MPSNGCFLWERPHERERQRDMMRCVNMSVKSPTDRILRTPTQLQSQTRVRTHNVTRTNVYTDTYFICMDRHKLAQARHDHSCTRVYAYTNWLFVFTRTLISTYPHISTQLCTRTHTHTYVCIFSRIRPRMCVY